jgi:hypothetical protein
MCLGLTLPTQLISVGLIWSFPLTFPALLLLDESNISVILFYLLHWFVVLPLLSVFSGYFREGFLALELLTFGARWFFTLETILSTWGVYSNPDLNLLDNANTFPPQVVTDVPRGTGLKLNSLSRYIQANIMPFTYSRRNLQKYIPHSPDPPYTLFVCLFVCLCLWCWDSNTGPVHARQVLCHSAPTPALHNCFCHAFYFHMCYKTLCIMVFTF